MNNDSKRLYLYTNNLQAIFRSYLSTYGQRRKEGTADSGSCSGPLGFMWPRPPENSKFSKLKKKNVF